MRSDVVLPEPRRTAVLMSFEAQKKDRECLRGLDFNA